MATFVYFTDTYTHTYTNIHTCIEVGLVLCQGHVLKKHHTNQTQNSHLKQCVYWGVRQLTASTCKGYDCSASRHKDLSSVYVLYIHYESMIVGPCHHDMVRPQVADGGRASNMEVSCKYIEYAVVDNRQGMVLQLGGWVRC